MFAGAALCEDENLVATTLQLVEDISKEHSKKVFEIYKIMMLYCFIHAVHFFRLGFEKGSKRATLRVSAAGRLDHPG